MKTFAIGVVAAVCFLLLVYLYGVQQHTKGYKQRSVEAEIEAAHLLEETRKKEHALLLELEEAYHDAYEQNKVAQATIDTLHADARSLRSVIATHRKQLTYSSTPTRADAASAAAWIALEECVGKYAEMAGVADGYVEVLRKGQGWGKVVNQVADPIAN